MNAVEYYSILSSTMIESHRTVQQLILLSNSIILQDLLCFSLPPTSPFFFLFPPPPPSSHPVTLLFVLFSSLWRIQYLFFKYSIQFSIVLGSHPLFSPFFLIWTRGGGAVLFPTEHSPLFSHTLFPGGGAERAGISYWCFQRGERGGFDGIEIS